MLGCRMALSCHWHFNGCLMMGKVKCGGLERHGWGMAGGEVIGGGGGGTAVRQIFSNRRFGAWGGSWVPCVTVTPL